MTGLLEAVAALLEARGIELSTWALGWARVLPLVTILPAFGARLLPPVGRVVLGLVLGLLIAPALPALPASNETWPLRLITEVLRGLPVALGASALLWAASMAGGVSDELRGGGQLARISMLEPDSSALGALFGLFAALGFLSLGGVTAALERLVAPSHPANLPLAAVSDLVASVEIALSLAAPLIALVIVVEVAGALMARAASPAHIVVLLAPLRALAVLVGLALALDGMFNWLLELLS